MKKAIGLFVFCGWVLFGNAQDVDYKKGMIQVNGSDYAKLEVTKQNFGLTKAFDVYSLTGEKIIIAVPATEFEADKNDNSFLYYRLTFMTASQVGIFKINALGQEKSFAKLIGQSGILIGNKVDENKVREFIASKGVTPRVAVNYTPVYRDRMWPIDVKADHTIEQNSKIIGSFKSTGSADGQDYYEFALPSGVVVAKVSFTGCNNAQNMELFTAKDNFKRTVPIPQKDKILAADVSIDKCYFTIRRIVKWLVDNQYL